MTLGSFATMAERADAQLCDCGHVLGLHKKHILDEFGGCRVPECTCHLFEFPRPTKPTRFPEGAEL